jgi:hypothetical protein
MVEPPSSTSLGQMCLVKSMGTGWGQGCVKAGVGPVTSTWGAILHDRVPGPCGPLNASALCRSVWVAVGGLER